MAKVWKFLRKTSEGISFSKVTNLQCSDCNFAIKTAHHRYFLEYVPKTCCLKKQYFEKKVYGGPASGGSCNPVVHSAQFYGKK